jgi:hypothetical protein
LNGLVGKSREVVQKLWAKITAEKNAYNAALAEYKVNHAQFSAKKTLLLDMLNPQKLDQHLAKSAQAIEDSWFTANLQRGMNSLVRDMSDDFEKVFAASEDIKKLMQGVYNTFIEKFGFQRMTIPSLDLDPQRTKLQLLVHQTEAFVRDPVNVVVKEKSFVVKNFYNTLVKASRANFSDAKSQAERWMQAVTLPLEVQIKDHKAQLQSRLDNLAKINEKTTSINEQMAVLKAAEADLRRQREMIEGLIARVSVHAATSSLDSDAPPAGALPRAQAVSPEMLATTKMATFEAPKPAPKPAPAKPAEPLISDTLMASLGTPKPAPAPAPLAPPAPSRETTQPMPDGAMSTQRLPANAQTTQRLPTDTQKLPPSKERAQQMINDGERTQKIRALDPNFRPEATQQMELPPTATQRLPTDTQKLPPSSSLAPLSPEEALKAAETTQRIDDSIWRLQEAKRILDNIPQKQKN